MKNNKGFSLIELMVVVAIIGILSAVAIPQYRNFQTKARQSEAKSDLGGLYTAEAAFHAEWGQYMSDFAEIGFNIGGEKYYATGFDAAGVNTPNTQFYTGMLGPDAAPVQFNTSMYADAPITFAAAAGQMAGCGELYADSTAPTVDHMFTAVACGNIDGDATEDKWSVTQDKNLTMMTNDVAN